jgi:hypothetical protein
MSQSIICYIMPEDSEHRFYSGAVGWIIIGIIAVIVVIFAVFLAFGSTIFPGRPGSGVQSETAQESATSGPGHNTTEASQPVQSGNESITSNASGPEQIPNAAVTFGRETSGVDTSTTGEQRDVNRTSNGTNGNLENPLSENITSLTGTAG